MTPSISGLNIGSSVVHGIALVATIYRLFHRYRIRRLSWDDAWAFAAFVLDVGELLCLWLKERTDHEVPAGTPEYQRRQSIAFWSMTILFTLIMACTRISLWVSIRRILAPGWPRNGCIPMAVLTGTAAIVIIIMKACMCTINTYSSLPVCTSSSALGIIQTIVDVALSVLLVALPLYALRYMDLPSAKRNLLMFLFTSSIFTLAAALVHNVYVLKPSRLLTHYTGHIELGIALLVCNIHIVVASLYTLHVRETESREPRPRQSWAHDSTVHSEDLNLDRTSSCTDAASSICGTDSYRPTSSHSQPTRYPVLEASDAATSVYTEESRTTSNKGGHRKRYLWLSFG
ncbi:hypothetical protein Moror_13795 [Moniliophthora roreri MCA 2997]|uniref:Rhodopsin domain-containing protein n=2 Tax=Moniliophthora roreri TaxID=221103 RepID=V2XQS0_MONRO|nr:hypothetical protein Moror_13795 [Moniliophthora roreri MCA 2997]